MSYVDVSTGHLRVERAGNLEELIEVVRRVGPTELLVPTEVLSVAVERNTPWLKELKRIARELGCRIVGRPFAEADPTQLEARIEALLGPVQAVQMGSNLNEVFGELEPPELAAIETVLDYVAEVSFGRVPCLAQFSMEERSASVFVDAATRRNLELTETRIDGERRNSLVAHIDYTRSAMGSRLLTDWLLSPSTELGRIEARLDSVEELVGRADIREQIRSMLGSVRDIDRLASRISAGRATPRDLASLSESIAGLDALGKLVSDLQSNQLAAIAEGFDPLNDIAEKLNGALVDDPPTKISEGGIFRDGFSREVDHLRTIRTDGRHWLAELESREKQRTGINGLKVRFNNVFGYFIEVTKANLHKVPADYERRQTLTNAERFVTRELKEYEVSLLSAKARQIELERELFDDLCNWVREQGRRIHRTSRLIGLLDALSALAHLAVMHNYCRPVLSNSLDTVIKGGRHPVVERVLGEHNYIANDVHLNGDNRRFSVLTGPNMGGKSTYLRQVGLIQLLAQAGSFVPAQSAKLGLADRIFTRIGAADDLARGDSTFMVEMREAAVIVKQATSRSLVLIDEVGRGTATSDGLAIAGAMAEWLHDRIGCRTIFATHFHELTELSSMRPGIFCLSVGVLEQSKEIVFTYRIEECAADRSYGIEVARLAGLPEPLLERAEYLISACDEEAPYSAAGELEISRLKPPETSGPVSGEFRCLADRVRALSPDAMTPLEALNVLNDLKKLLGES